eukprot:Phypoly_transcript_09861.p1 GENE.Phypoly_transcript_09861~~Phypoly_transcript_09861.p1  ORF type:complete len:156 (+),score=24.38 Phypoly_transcript_09861:495-962(+)
MESMEDSYGPDKGDQLPEAYIVVTCPTNPSTNAPIRLTRSEPIPDPPPRQENAEALDVSRAETQVEHQRYQALLDYTNAMGKWEKDVVRYDKEVKKWERGREIWDKEQQEKRGRMSAEVRARMRKRKREDKTPTVVEWEDINRMCGVLVPCVPIV